MPLQTEYVDFEEERKRLYGEMEEIAEQQANWDGRDEHARQLMQQGNAIENQHTVLKALMEGDIQGVPAMEGVTLAGLTTGDVNRVEDIVEKHSSVRERDAWVAIGTIDAPYLQHDPDGDFTMSEYEDTVLAVTDLPLPYVRWAEGRISELSHLGADEGNGYLALVREKQANTP